MATSRNQKIGGTVGVLALASAIAFPHIQKWEGLETKPYVDIVGVKTVCYGETRVEMRPYTPAECRAMAIKALQQDFGPIVLRCTPSIANQRPEALASALLLTYNIGGAAYCRSTAAKRFNAGRWREGCDAYLMWNKAGGRVVRGLTLRRQDERRLCLVGVGG
jgi:lysozyme